MSLQIWLPLDGNLNNQGPLSCSITPGSGVSLDHDGKTGNCYYINNSSIELNPAAIKSLGWTSMSACGWFKIIAFRSSYDGFIMCTDGTGWNNARFGFSQNVGKNICIEGGGSYQNAFVANTEQWYHFALTFANRTLKFYVNGALIKTLSTSGDLNLSTINKFSIGTWNGSFNGNMKVNDVRIYNHELTEAEVRLIMARELMIHYPLNGMPANTLNKVFDISGNGYHASINGNNGEQSIIIADNTAPRYKNICSLRNNKYIIYDLDSGITNYSFSFWCYLANSITSTTTLQALFFWSYPGQNYSAAKCGLFIRENNARLSFVLNGQSTDIIPSPLTVGAWNHVAVTVENNIGKVYINNELKNTFTSSTNQTGEKLTLGCYNESTWYLTDINLSDFRLYTKCLSTDEISSLYHMGA